MLGLAVFEAEAVRLLEGETLPEGEDEELGDTVVVCVAVDELLELGLAVLVPVDDAVEDEETELEDEGDFEGVEVNDAVCVELWLAVFDGVRDTVEEGVSVNVLVLDGVPEGVELELAVELLVLDNVGDSV